MRYLLFCSKNTWSLLVLNRYRYRYFLSLLVKYSYSFTLCSYPIPMLLPSSSLCARTLGWGSRCGTRGTTWLTGSTSCPSSPPPTPSRTPHLTCPNPRSRSCRRSSRPASSSARTLLPVRSKGVPVHIRLGQFVSKIWNWNIYSLWQTHFTQKNGKTFLKVFLHNWLANLHGFVNICKLRVSNNFKDMQSKIW